MVEVGGLPEGLAEMPPGPGLSALLATVEPASLNGCALVDLLCARHRQVGWEQAQLLSVVREVAYAPEAGVDAPPARAADWDPHAGREIAFALGWTDYAATAMLDLALAAIEKLPAVHAALAAGELDLPRARVICDELEELDAEAARPIAARILAGGPVTATTGQLREQIRRLVLQVDPDAAQKRHDKALNDRRVEKHDYANGTAGLFGSYLAKDKAAAAWDNIDRIAAATKAAGETRNLDHVGGADQRIAVAPMCTPTCWPGSTPPRPGRPAPPPARGWCTCTSSWPPGCAWPSTPAASTGSARSPPTSPVRSPTPSATPPCSGSA